jgi:hypothetical protein
MRKIIIVGLSYKGDTIEGLVQWKGRENGKSTGG